MQYLPILIVVLLCALVLVRVVRSAKDSTGKKSFSLAGIQITAFMIFGVVFMDTINDRPPPILHKYEHVASLKSSTKAASQKKNRRRQVRESTSGASVRSRMIIKEKYYILGTVFLAFCLLYAFGHKGPIREAIIKFGMAMRKMDPYEHVLDEKLVGLLEKNFDDKEARQFFLDALLAKKGKSKIAANNNDDGPTKDDLVTGP